MFTKSPAFSPDTPTDFSSLMSMLGLALGGVLLSWYLDVVSPGEEGGYPKPLYFIFNPYVRKRGKKIVLVCVCLTFFLVVGNSY